MTDPGLWHRLQFAFTIVYHYLFPQLTMGLALVIVVWRCWHCVRGDEQYALAARFWTRIFGVNFAFGVVTGVPMEFQFGTNWARFSSYAGGVIGQTLGDGRDVRVLSGERVRGSAGVRRDEAGPAPALRRGARWSASAAGSRGYFIIATNAFMQHPVGYAIAARRLALRSRTSGRSC